MVGFHFPPVRPGVHRPHSREMSGDKLIEFLARSNPRCMVSVTGGRKSRQTGLQLRLHLIRPVASTAILADWQRTTPNLIKSLSRRGRSTDISTKVPDKESVLIVRIMNESE